MKQGKRWETTPLDIARQISVELANSALISSVNDKLWDMGRPLEADCSLEFFSFDTEKGRDTFWHSSAHILAQVNTFNLMSLIVKKNEIHSAQFIFAAGYRTGVWL